MYIMYWVVLWGDMVGIGRYIIIIECDLLVFLKYVSIIVFFFFCLVFRID